MQAFIEYCTIISNKFKKNKGSPKRFIKIKKITKKGY